MFLAKNDNGLPPVVDERVGVLSLKLDDVAVTVLAKVLGAQICQLIPAPGVAYASPSSCTKVP